MHVINLPEFTEVDAKLKAGKSITAVEKFVHTWEPVGPQELEFRDGLAALIMEVEQEEADRGKE